MRCVVLALAALLPLAAHAQREPEITIQLPAGATATGTLVRNARNESIQAFRGIRYAEAPTGANRWKPSTLLSPRGAINATAFGSICYADSRYDPTPLFPQSEDCLFLNVYAPASATAASNLPVMVWTHGGTWVFGSGNIYDGRNLVGAGGNDVVFVSINYRLGVFGLLANQQLLQEGNGANAALRDMQTAHQWVRDHIGAFGGNPNDVTAFGESAGAFMVALQMITDHGGQKLFDKAILESGAYPSSSQIMTVAQQDAYVGKVADKVGCNGPDAAKVLACLRTTDAVALMAAGGNMDWRPIVDGKFLVDLPYKLVAANTVSKIPAVIGTNTHEGFIFVKGVTSDDASVMPYIGRAFPIFTSDDLTRLAALYPATAFASPVHRAGEIISDLIFVCPSEKTTEMLAPSEASYRYRFNQTDPMFGTAGVPRRRSQRLVAGMQTFWTNFARFGSPNGRTQDGGAALAWPRFDNAAKQQIVLQKGPLGIETNGAYMAQHVERCAFLNGVEARVASTSGEAYKPTAAGPVQCKDASQTVAEEQVSLVQSFAMGVTQDAEAVPFFTVKTWLLAMTTDEFTKLDGLYYEVHGIGLASPAQRAGEMLGDLVFVCPSEKLTETLAQCEATYHHRFNET